MDKDRRVSIETLNSLMSVWELCTQLFARNWKCGRFARSLSQWLEKKTLSWQQGDYQADQFRSRSSRCSRDLGWKLDLLLWPWHQETEFQVEVCWLSQTQEGQTANPPTNFWWSLFWQHWHDLHALDSHWRDNQQGILCSGFKGVQVEIPSEEASTLHIRSVAFPAEQCTSPQHDPCHRLFEQDGHQDSSSPFL